jgi:lysophospholipase L1-like esterase
MSTFNDEMDHLEIIRYFMAFQSPEKRFPLYSGTGSLRNVAAFMGISENELLEARKRFDEIAKNTAVELLSDPEIQSQLRRIPIKNGQTIVAFGDSLTDDKQGWFEIFRHMLEINTPNPSYEFINMGISGDTSYDALRRVRRVIEVEPDWVFVAFGTNDASRPLVAPDRTTVSLAEFWENMNVISKVFDEFIPNPVVWITPPAVITQMMEDLGFFDGLIHEEDLVQYREVLSGKPGYIIDPHGTRMGNPPQLWNFMSDGLHHTPAGHEQTVRAVLQGLANTSEATEGKQLPRLS